MPHLLFLSLSRIRLHGRNISKGLEATSLAHPFHHSPPSCTLHFSLSGQTACPLILARPWGHAAVRFKLKRQDYVTGYLIRSGSRRKRERRLRRTANLATVSRTFFRRRKERWTDDPRGSSGSSSLSSKGLLVNV